MRQVVVFDLSSLKLQRPVSDSSAVLFESPAQVTVNSKGQLLVSDGRNYIFFAWWLSAFPGAALALTALGVNLTGDWLRDTLDPRLRI